jgi:outer membrane receptor protein involved in Fe transport
MAFWPGRVFPGLLTFRKTTAVLLPVLLCLQVGTPDARAEMAVSDTVVVSARALGDAVTPSAGGLVTVIDLEEESGHRDLAEILGRTAGFQVRQYGGLGFAAVPSLRGSAAAQIRIFVDGLPLNDAQSGSVDLSLLSVERFSRAEVHRGIVPGGLGGMGGAGAVNLITRTRADGLDAGFFAGGFGSLGGRLNWGIASEDESRSILLLAHGRRADNDYEYLDNYQTFDNTADDTTRTRQNSWFEEWGLGGSGHLAAGPLDLRLNGGWFRKDGGRPGPINYPSPSATVRVDRLDGQIAVMLPRQLMVEMASARVEQFLFDPENEIDDGFDGDIRSVSTDLTGRMSWSPNLWLSNSSQSFLSRVNLTAGVERRNQWYSQWYGLEEDPRRNRQSDSAFASLPLAFFNELLQVTPAWRYQRNEDNFPPLPQFPWLDEEAGVQNIRHDVSPSVGLVWELARDTWFLEAHGSRSVRVPTWVELFGHRGGIDGNRDLQPEEISAADVAIVWNPSPGISNRLTAFVARTDQTIIFIQNSIGTSHAQNIGATHNRGLEWEGRFALPNHLDLQANATWQRPLDEGDQPEYNGNRLPYLSDVEIDVRLSRPFGLWRPWLEASYESEKYRDRNNTDLIRAPSRTLWNVGLTRVVGESLDLSAEVINLTDDRTYDVVQFPLPGRTWQVAMRLNH